MYLCSHWYYHAVLVLYFINVVYTCMRMDAQSFQLLAIPWTVAKFLCPWVFSGRNTGIGCHFLLQGDLPDPGIESQSPTWQTDSLPLHLPGSIWVDLGNSTPTSYSWDKYHLGVVYSPSAVFHGFISCGKNLCIYVYQIYWQVLFFPIDVYLYILPSDRTKIKLY